MHLSTPLLSTHLLSTYNDAGLLCNVSFNGKTSNANQYAYRGDLVLEEGEIADAQGRRMPPTTVVRQAIVLASDAKITLLIGALHELALLDLVMARYLKDFDTNTHLLFFVENIGKPLKIDLSGFNAVVLPITDTSVWNETIDELRLEKDDFKGQSSEDKVVTLLHALSDYKPKYPAMTYQDALGLTIEVKREGRGAV
jgi:hypothetical protein